VDYQTRHRCDRDAAILKMARAGHGIYEIAATLHVSRNTVTAVCDREGVPVRQQYSTRPAVDEEQHADVMRRAAEIRNKGWTGPDGKRHAPWFPEEAVFEDDNEKV